MGVASGTVESILGLSIFMVIYVAMNVCFF
jgi:hypothetical protein